MTDSGEELVGVRTLIMAPDEVAEIEFGTGAGTPPFILMRGGEPPEDKRDRADGYLDIIVQGPGFTSLADVAATLEELAGILRQQEQAEREH